MIHLSGPETRRCPPEFQERLTRKFGRNAFGDPLFKISWCQSTFIRLGWQWKDSFGRAHYGYRERYQGDGSPCWMIMRWKPPIHYGSPDTYYANTWIPCVDSSEQGFDSPDGFYVTGEYPWKGRYEIVVPMVRREFVDKKLVISHFPLSHYLIDTLIPMIVAFQELSREEQEAANRAAEEAKAKQENDEIAQRMLDALPPWYGPVSYSRQGCRTSLLDKKMHEIQKRWDQLSRNGLRPNFQPGIAIGDRPAVVGYK